MIKRIPTALYCVVVICFFMPWISFSCMGERVMTLSGVQLVTGLELEGFEGLVPEEERKIDPNPFIVLALGAVIAGIGLSFLRGKKGTIGSTLMGGLGVLSLLAFKLQVDNAAARESGGAVRPDYEFGFYFTLILFLLAIGASFLPANQLKNVSLPQVHSGGTAKFCSECGARNIKTNKFCTECGANLF